MHAPLTHRAHSMWRSEILVEVQMVEMVSAKHTLLMLKSQYEDPIECCTNVEIV